jgi:hypothetical protein
VISKRTAVIAVAGAAVVTLAVAIPVAVFSGSPPHGSVSACAAAVAAGEEAGTLHRSSPVPASCEGLSSVQLGDAVGQALTQYTAYEAAKGH